MPDPRTTQDHQVQYNRPLVRHKRAIKVTSETASIYAAGWDDTNVLYFASRETAQPVLDLALSATLHVLDYGS